MAPPAAEELDYKPLDGGWGWMVVIGAHICIGFAYAVPKSLSVFFTEIQEDLGVSSSEIAWIPSTILAVMYAGGPVSSVLVRRFGSRPVVILGGLLCAASMVTASFGTSIIHLYLCVGIIGGFGLALNLNAALTIISKYFLNRRPLANGLAMAGSPLFLCILAPVNQCLLQNYGWRGSFFIIGGLTLNCCVGGALMRPVIPPPKPSTSTPQTQVEEQPNLSNTKPNGICMDNAKMFLDFSLFKDRGFVIYLIGNVMYIFGAYGPVVFLPSYAIAQGIEEYSASLLLSILSLVDMIVRPCTGVIAGSKRVRPKIQYLFSFAMVLNGTCHLLCPLSTSYAMLVTYVVFFGVFFGVVFALIFECLMDLMGTERFPRAVGLATVVEGLPMLVGPPAAGFLVDIYGDYSYLFFMCGAVIVCGGLFLLVMNIYIYYMLAKENSAEDSEQISKNVKSQDQVEVSVVEMKQTPEVAMERTEPEAKEPNEASKASECRNTKLNGS